MMEQANLQGGTFSPLIKTVLKQANVFARNNNLTTLFIGRALKSHAFQQFIHSQATHGISHANKLLISQHRKLFKRVQGTLLCARTT